MSFPVNSIASSLHCGLRIFRAICNGGERGCFFSVEKSMRKELRSEESNFMGSNPHPRPWVGCLSQNKGCLGSRDARFISVALFPSSPWKRLKMGIILL